MSNYGSGNYSAGPYGITLSEITNLSVTNPGIGNTLDLTWNNPSYPSFDGVLILRNTSTISDVPTQTTAYSVGNFIGTSEVVFKGTSSEEFFRNTGLTDGLPYYYRVFTRTTSDTYTDTGVESLSIPTDITAPAVSNFRVIDSHVDGKLLLYWDNPLDADFAGLKLLRREDRYPEHITDGALIYEGANNEYIETGLENYKFYYYSIFAYDEAPNYSDPVSAHNRIRVFVERVLHIPSEITGLQADVDKASIILNWDSIERSYSFTALTKNSNDVGLTTRITSNDLTAPSSTDTTFTVPLISGISTTDDIYNDLQAVILTGRNIMGRSKTIKSYTYSATPSFVIDKVEHSGELNEHYFGLSTIQSLIDDNSIYIDSNLNHNDNDYKVSAYDWQTRTFTFAASSSVQAGDSFIFNTSYYPKLYISSDKGETYDDGINLTYTIETSAAPINRNDNTYYNEFEVSSSTLLDYTDPNLYIGNYITFITGQNKGFSRRILDFGGSSTNIFTTEYFNFPISENDVFSINTYSIPLVSHIEDYRFKIRFWNNDSVNPIYGNSAIVKPSISLQNYLDALDSGYWDTDVTTDLYSVMQGIAKGGHSKVDHEIVLQKNDFSIEEVRDSKLYTNFGGLFPLTKHPDISFEDYRKRLSDVNQGLRQGSSYEGLFNIARAFTTITPTTQFLTEDGWRLGERRIGYGKSITSTTVVSGDNSSPYNTMTIASTGTFSDNDFVSFTNAPPGTQDFDLNLIGQLIPVTSFSASGSPSMLTIEPIGTPIPDGANIDIFSPTASNYGTRPYSNLSYLFGIKISIYGPRLDDTDLEALDILLAKVIPLHVRYFVSYNTNIYAESSLSEFNGDRTALEIDYSTGVLLPNEEEINEFNSRKDSINLAITSVIDTTNTFAVSGATITESYYKDKYVKFNTGNNTGISRRVIDYYRYNNNFFTEDFPYVIQEGDQFQIDKISYQTKYVSGEMDLGTTDFGNNTYVASWYARKRAEDVVDEMVHIQFSDDGITFDTPREIYQNEVVNELISSEVISGTSTTTFSASGGTEGTFSVIDDFYVGGSVKFLTGPNIGVTRDIVGYNAITNVFTTEAFSFTSQANDSFIIILTDMKRYFRMIIYHNNIVSSKDVEIESLALKVL